MVVVIMHCTFRLSIDITDDIDALILYFMMQSIMRVLAGYESHCRTCEIWSVHNSSLQRNAWLMEILRKSLLVRCLGLLRMQRHVIITLCNKLRSKTYLHDSLYFNV